MNGSLEPHVALKLIFAFIAGFSESLVPNLLRRGEKSVSGSEKQDGSDAPIVKDMKPA
jgi:hypothetical protein